MSLLSHNNGHPLTLHEALKQLAANRLNASLGRAVESGFIPSEWEFHDHEHTPFVVAPSPPEHAFMHLKFSKHTTLVCFFLYFYFK
jgi:hypothetical protein